MSLKTSSPSSKDPAGHTSSLPAHWRRGCLLAALTVFCVAAAVSYEMSAIGQADALDAWWLRARFSAREAKDITPDGKRIPGALIRFGVEGLVRNELKGALGNIFGGSLSGVLGNVLGGSVGGALGNVLAGGRGGGLPRLPF